MSIFFTSDHHFGHPNIIKLYGRPYKDTNCMDRDLIRLWNETVLESDTVFVIGDLSLSSNGNKIKNWVSKLNGTKHLILGNHDVLKPFSYIDCGFASVHTSYCLNGVRIFEKSRMFDDLYMAHDPAIKTALKDTDLLLHGHVHELWKDIPNKNLINVGVDVWNYRPVSLDQINELIKGWK